MECPPKARLLETWKSPKLRYSAPQLSTCRLLPASASHLLLPRTDQCNVRVRETFERCRIFDLKSLSVGSLPCRRRFLRLRSPSTWQSGPVRSQRSDSQPPSITAIHFQRRSRYHKPRRRKLQFHSDENRGPSRYATQDGFAAFPEMIAPVAARFQRRHAYNNHLDKKC